jgi:2-phosphoglycerate kinase
MLEAPDGRPRVILIGGAPRSGKGTIARILAARVCYDLVHTDDLGTAARAVTSPATQPDLHPMTGWDYRDYYLRNSNDELWEDALRSHRALWPAVEAVVNLRSNWGAPAIVEGWAILPDLAQRLNLSTTFVCWLLVKPDVLAERIRRDHDFSRGAVDKELLVAAFTERSRRYNDHVREHAGPHVLRIEQETPEEIADHILGLADSDPGGRAARKQRAP